MYSFANDYSEGASEEIIRRLVETNREQLPGYGSDRYCESAKAKIRAACGDENADVFFLFGGTQTNKTVIGACLAEEEGVIACSTGHIELHEAGAIEETGHKVIALPGKDGKVVPAVVREYLETFYADESHTHMVYPGMIYISYPTEYGTLYTKEELAALHDLCREYEMLFYIDGARLGYGLASPEADVTLRDIAALSDCFYIGGTKVGALCGEAVVFPRGGMPRHFLTRVKRYGALMAKGRLVGIQFDTLFTDGLYEKNSENAIRTAIRLREILKEKNFRFYIDSPTNQTFVILENEYYKKISEKVAVSFWEKYDDTHTVVRFATSWATPMEAVESLREIL